MDHFSYEAIGKERVKGFQQEGLRNQEVHRATVGRIGLLHGLPKLMLGLLGMLSILSFLVR